MEFISVIVAAVAGFAFGAAWYMTLSRQWVAASGIEVDENGQPANKSKTPFILAGIAMLLVAGMMRHTFAMSGIDTLAAGLVGGLGVGLFFISPWIMINNAYGDRPFNLTLIDGGYATFGCGVIGAVLGIL
ncbi:MAG: DUF1761 domain-containing protein [Boseongicola sp. SB0677_bin_26]|nr:DUF1761 domain-containing protein [Boseongicola sp. SB0665_bin_10]MYG27838.1 DUF1761 domain-containing protein [Boseongicola sp. SB0677_bin_26]